MLSSKEMSNTTTQTSSRVFTAVAILACALCEILMIHHVVTGFTSGEVVSFMKGNHGALVLRAAEPLLFWVSMDVHTCIALIVGALLYCFTPASTARASRTGILNFWSIFTSIPASTNKLSTMVSVFRCGSL